MIFVTVGTHTQSFNRLLKKMDNLIESGKINERVVAQIGHSTYIPKRMEWFRFTDLDKLNSFYSKSRIIVAHGGAGSILNGIVNGVSVVAVPRLKRYNEHVNDHQIEIVKKLEEKGKITAVYDIDDIDNALKSVKKRKKIKKDTRLCDEICKFLLTQENDIK